MPFHLTLDARKAFDSGIGTYIRNLIPFLKQEFEVSLIGDKEELSSFDCRVFPMENNTYSVADLHKPSLLAGKCDVFWTPHFNFPILPPRAKLKIASVHDLYHLAYWPLLSMPQKVYYKLFLNNLVRNVDLIFTISDFTKGEIGKFFPKALHKVTKIHLGVDFSLFKLTEDARKMQDVRHKYALPERFVLFVGNLKPNKNVITLLRAYHDLLGEQPNLDWKVVITGKKEGFKIGDNEAVDFIRTHQLEERVIFTGFVDEKDLSVVYQLAELFVFPSLYEGFGLPPLEAMACGCPVACSTSASIPEVCQDHAFYFDGQDPKELSQLLAGLLSNHGVLQSKADDALTWVKKYDWGFTAEEHIRAIKNALARNN